VNSAKSVGIEGDGADDVKLAKICIALDPVALIRLRHFRATIDGAARMLAVRFADETVRAEFTAILRYNLAGFCTRLNSRLRPEIQRLASAFERISPFVLREEIGFGLERAMYTLNANAPCRSPLFEDDYVADLSLLVPALERQAKNKGAAFDSLIDRHIAAFAAARLKTNIASELRALRDAKDRFGYALPAARILALVQIQAGSGAAPTLCGAIASMLEPALARYHNRNTRDRIRARLQEIAKSGRLDALVDVIDDPKAIEQDTREFARAAADHAATVQQIERLAYERANRDAISRAISSQVASLFSGVAATVAVLVILLMKLI
jgi:hypothetical protein